jgi:hypothetical protein
MSKNPVFVNEYGKTTLELKYIGMPKSSTEKPEDIKDVLEVRAVALGAMPVTLWIRPLELFQAIKIVQKGVITRAIKMVFAGRKAYNKAKKAEKNAAK